MHFDKEKLDKWSNAAEEDEKVVFTFLSQSGFDLKNTRGSHRTYEHQLLSRCANRFPDYFKEESLKSGRLIVICHKGKCQKYILKRIIEACSVIEEFIELENKHGGMINHDKKH